MEELKINPKFKDVIPPLSEDEYAELRESIKTEGCRDAIIVWDGVIVDGHNRFAICTELNIPFNIWEKKFANEESAIEWIMRNQLGRRNLSDVERGRIALKLEERIAARARENLIKSGECFGVGKGSPNCADPISAIVTREEVAKIAGISHTTLSKIKKVDAEAPAVISQAMGKTISIDRAAKLNDELRKLPEDKREAEAKDMLSPERQKQWDKICYEEKVVKKLHNIYASAAMDNGYICEECVDIYIHKSCASVKSIVRTIDYQIESLNKLKELFLAREKLFEGEQLWKVI